MAIGTDEPVLCQLDAPILVNVNYLVRRVA